MCANPSSLTIVPDIKLPTVDGRQLSPENCVSPNKEVKYIIAKKKNEFIARLSKGIKVLKVTGSD